MEYLVETTRLRMRAFIEADDVFIHRLLNTPTWLQFIGDRHITTLADAQGYLQNGPLSSYRIHGYGPWLVELKAGQQPIGMCGFFKRGFLQAPDAGFAFLPEYEGCGYAYEALAAAITYAQATFGVKELFAITLPGNTRCIRLLEKTGFHFRELIKPPGETHALMLFAAQTDGALPPSEI